MRRSFVLRPFLLLLLLVSLDRPLELRAESERAAETLFQERNRVRQLETGADAVDELPAGFSEVTSRLQQSGAFSGGFVQKKHIPALRKPLVSEGSFIFVPEQGLCWITEQPFRSELVVREDSIFERAADGSSEALFTENEAVLEGFARIFLAAFAGKVEALSERFAVYFDGAPSAWRLGFKPRSGAATRMLEHIQLSGGEQVQHFTLETVRGERTEISLRPASDEQKAGAGGQHDCFERGR